MLGDLLRVAVVQSSFLPWLGYFDLIESVDHFIFLEDVQYTKRDWRNRNRIKTPNGAAWISIPVQHRHGEHQTIREIRTMDNGWSRKFQETLKRNYAKSPYFDEVMSLISARLDRAEGASLSTLNQGLIMDICAYLKISTETSEAPVTEENLSPSARLAEISRSAGADTYISGPSAKVYLEAKAFWDLGLEVDFVEYPPVFKTCWANVFNS